MTIERQALTNLPIHSVKSVVFWGILRVFGVLFSIYPHVLEWQNHTRIVEDVPQTEIPPPDGEPMRKTGRWRAGTDQGIDRPSRARLCACGMPRFGELKPPFCQFGVELEQGGRKLLSARKQKAEERSCYKVLVAERILPLSGLTRVCILDFHLP